MSQTKSFVLELVDPSDLSVEERRYISIIAQQKYLEEYRANLLDVISYTMDAHGGISYIGGEENPTVTHDPSEVFHYLYPWLDDMIDDLNKESTILLQKIMGDNDE